MNEEKIAEVNRLVRKHSRNELVQLCKEKNLPCSGTKHDLSVRLIGGFTKTQEEKQVIIEQVRKLKITRNTHGQWEFEGLIFDKNTKNVIGWVENGDPEVKPLQRDQIEKCKQYKFKYNLPEILDERQDIDNSKIYELSTEDEAENDEDDENDDDNNENEF